MAESTTHMKSLKPFIEILQSSEAEYRNSPPDGRGEVIRRIMDEIHEAAAEKGKAVANDDLLRKVGTYMYCLLLVQALNYLFVGGSKS
jgi:hypothetical protein